MEYWYESKGWCGEFGMENPTVPIHWEQWRMLVPQLLGRLRQEDHKFKADLGNIARTYLKA